MFMKAQEPLEPRLNSKKTVITSPQSAQSERSVNQSRFYRLRHHRFPLEVFFFFFNASYKLGDSLKDADGTDRAEQSRAELGSARK